jgi:hypothetical protein
MILIYTIKSAPRLGYITRLLFGDILGVETELVTDAVVFRNSELPKLNYSCCRLKDEPFIRAGDFLFSTSLQIPDLAPVDFEDETGFFATSSDSLLPFDPLASAFLAVSRIEEYLPGGRDAHGRFEGRNSLLYHLGLHEKPVVNIWARMLADRLRMVYPQLKFRKTAFTYLATIDIDNAWAYLHKGLARTMASSLRDIFKGRFGEIRERLLVWTGKKPDPYDTWSYLRSVYKETPGKVMFFFHLGDYHRFDKPVSWKNKAFQKVIREIVSQFRVGIHPSYNSSSQKHGHQLLAAEKKRLEEITGRKIDASRQHYLRLEFPITYQRLLKAGISEDYTMGYADIAGFRAGICTPFKFYDLTAEQETSLTVYPFQVMDVTLRQYMKLSPEEAKKKIGLLISRIEDVGGVFTGIWHNESVSDTGEWKDFRQVFEFMNHQGLSYETR